MGLAGEFRSRGFVMRLGTEGGFLWFTSHHCTSPLQFNSIFSSPALSLSPLSLPKTGSDVAKDASDIVLADDNFASIGNGIEEGRRMFNNIISLTTHLLSQNIAQASVLLIGLAFKDEDGLSVFPLSPVAILYGK